MINSFTANKKGNQWTVTLVAQTDDLTDIFKDLMYLLEPEVVSPDKPSVTPDKPRELKSGITYEPRRDLRTNIQGILDCLRKCNTDLAFKDARPIRHDILATLTKYASDAMQGLNYEEAKADYEQAHYHYIGNEEEMTF